MTFSGQVLPTTTNPLRFADALNMTARMFGMTAGTIDDCADACLLDDRCLGFYYRITGTAPGATQCTGLSSLGTNTNGVKTSQNSTSWTKVVSGANQFMTSEQIRTFKLLSDDKFPTNVGATRQGPAQLHSGRGFDDTKPDDQHLPSRDSQDQHVCRVHLKSI